MGKKLYVRTCRFCGSEISFYHGEKSEMCLNCGNGDWTKPDTETKLFLLQKRWIETRDKDVLSEMYTILLGYVKSKIKKILNGTIIYEEEKLEEKAEDSVTLLMEYYLTKEGFQIDSSFMGYLTKQIKSVLYNRPQQFADSVESLNYILDLNSGKELIDTVEIHPIHENSMNSDFVFKSQREDDLVLGIMKIVEDIHTEVFLNDSGTRPICLLIGIYHSMGRKSEDYMNSFYERFGRNRLKVYVEETMKMIHKFIKDR